VDIQDGRYQRIYPRLLLEKVTGRIELTGNQAEIEKIQGILNGGKASASGKMGLSGWLIPEAEIILKSEESLFDFPKGLHSQVSGDLKFISDGKTYQAAGTMTILDARYRDDFKVGTAVYNFLRRGSIPETLREPNPFLKKLNLDINIGIPNNFIIDNNISNAEVLGDLRLVGTPYNPGLSGRVSVAEGGEIYFNQNTFSVEQGTVDFINPTRIEPDLNLSARTQVQDYSIHLIVQGTPGKLTASLVSDPPLSEPNIISLLVMGKTLESASASVATVAGSTALSYLNNAITGTIEQATAKVLGLESVRIDAGLVSTEENPEARITIGQHLSRDFELVFSQDLKDARNQMWMLNYNPFRSFNIQGIKRDNNELNLALRHEIQFGLKADPHQIPGDKGEIKELTVGNIQLEGNMSLPESAILQSLKLKKGKKINFAELQKALERIRKLYQKNNHLNLSLAVKREETDGKLGISLRIDSGPKIFLDYEGDQIPDKIKKEIVETWFGSPFGQLAMEDIEQKIRIHFMEKRFYQVQVKSTEKRGGKGERILVFQTIKGHRFGKPDFRIAGTRALSDKVIAAHLERSGAMNYAFYRPAEWIKSIEEFYNLQGYLRPKIKLPVVHLDPEENRASVDVSLEEGSRFKVGIIKIAGLHFFEENQIHSEIGVLTGDIVSPVKINQIDRKIYDLYVQMGFNDVRVQSDIQVNVDKSTVDLNIDIQENQIGVIAQIEIEGNKLTDKKTILRELKFYKGDVVNFRTINATRKGLYDLGIFERVSIDINPLKQDEKNLYFQVAINVIEFKPYRLRYGFQYDTETSFGVLASLVNRNFLGNADLLGGSFRLNRDERDTRVFFRSPYFFFQKISTEFFLFSNRLTKQAFTLDRTGFTLQQQLKIKMSNVISYNFTFEKIDTFYPIFEGVQNMDTTARIGTFNVAFTRDTRDDIVDTTRGIFLSQSLRYAPGFFRSNAQFIRYFGQFNTYQKLSDLFTYAASIRIGLGKGLNEELPASERFFAGGGTTIRGFKKDEIGPRDSSTDLPLGGDAVFILNQELRFAIFKKFGGVIFLDLGNVYPKISDFDILDIRKTAGIGFRLHTPFVLVRLDWGFKLDRRPGETLSQIFFSIGQAF
jgi:outer membrane protein assembly complex protein YaeT